MPRRPGPQTRYSTLGKTGVLTTPFGGKTTQEATHPGIDLAAPSGTPVKAPTSGVVTKVDLGHADGENSFGNTVEIKDATGKIHQFHHLQGASVKPGQKVAKGQPVMTVGKTGAVYSPSGGDPSSIDYRIVDRYKKYKNPTPYIKNL